MTRTLTDADVLDQLRRLIEHHGSLRSAAGKLRLSPQFLSAVLNRTRKISPRLLNVLHLRQVITFEERPILPSERTSHTAILDQIRRRTATLEDIRRRSAKS